LIDYAFGIEVWSPDDLVSIRIGGAFLLKSQSGERKLFAEKEPMALGSALSVLHKTLESAIAYKNGMLSLKFSNDIRIDVPPDDKYEAWEINSRDGVILVSLPAETSRLVGQEGYFARYVRPPKHHRPALVSP
jgi:hypothetical protein